MEFLSWKLDRLKLKKEAFMQVLAERTGEGGGLVNVPTGSTIKDCFDAAQVKYFPGENIYLNGLEVVNGRKVDLNTVVKDNDTVQIVPNYSGGKLGSLSDGENSICLGYGQKICSESLIPSLR